MTRVERGRGREAPGFCALQCLPGRRPRRGSGGLCSLVLAGSAPGPPRLRSPRRSNGTGWASLASLSLRWPQPAGVPGPQSRPERCQAPPAPQASPDSHFLPPPHGPQSQHLVGVSSELGGGGPGARRSPSAGTVWEAPWGCGNQSVWGRSPARGRRRGWGRRPEAGGRETSPGGQGRQIPPPRPSGDPRPSVGARSPKAPSPAPISPITGALPTPWGAYSRHSTPPSLSVLFCKMGRPCWCRPRAWGAGEVRRAGPALPRPARLPGAGPSPCLCGYPSAFTSLRPGAAGDTAG